MQDHDPSPFVLSYLFTTFEHRALSEVGLAEQVGRLPELFGREPGATTPAELSGFVSMTHGGVELLGDPYWVEDVKLLSLGGGIDHFAGQQFELRSTPLESNDTTLLIELFERDKPRFSRTIARSAFEQEWQLLRARAERVRETLGDPSATTWLNDWHRGWPATVRYQVPQHLRDYCRHEELSELLTHPQPVL